MNKTVMAFHLVTFGHVATQDKN